jgi:membrane protein DedA with SNARE-associated domain
MHPTLFVPGAEVKLLHEISYEGGYAVFFFWILANRAGVPLPATPALIGAGVFAGDGDMRLSLVLLLGVWATLLSDSLWFWLGRRYGHRILNLMCRFSVEPDSCVHRAEHFLLRHGVKSLLFSKFVPGMNRSTLPLTGTARIPFTRFLLWDAGGALLWTGAYAGIGFAFSDEIQEAADQILRIGGEAVIAFFGLLVVVYMVAKVVRRRRAIEEVVHRISAGELRNKIDSGVPLVILDLRDEAEMESDRRTIPGALRVSGAEVDDFCSRLKMEDEIILYCT